MYVVAHVFGQAYVFTFRYGLLVAAQLSPSWSKSVTVVFRVVVVGRKIRRSFQTGAAVQGGDTQ